MPHYRGEGNESPYALGRVFCGNCKKGYFPVAEANRNRGGVAICPDCGKPVRTSSHHTPKSYRGGFRLLN